MVSLTDVPSSNSRIASTLFSSLVAVFVGATSGVGETSLKQFAKHTRQPRIYFIGRSQAAGDRIAAECKTLNSEGEYIFIKADTSLIRSVDDVCRDIKSKEKAVNLLFLSTGSLISTETSEGTALIKLFPQSIHRQSFTPPATGHRPSSGCHRIHCWQSKALFGGPSLPSCPGLLC